MLMMRPPSFASASACSSGVQGAQAAVVVAAADGDADDGHAGRARFVDQAVHIATAEQFAEQDEDVALAEQLASGCGEGLGIRSYCYLPF
jgi:hypothetical protein